MNRKVRNTISFQPGLGLGILIFFLIGLFDIALLFSHRESGYPFLETVFGANHFLSIYVVFGAIIGLICNFVQRIFFGRRKSHPDGLDLVRFDINFYITFIVFLSLMYCVHTRLIASPILGFTSIVATIGIILLSALFYLAFYKISIKMIRAGRFSWLKNIVALARISPTLFVFALFIFPLTSLYIHLFPLNPFISSKVADTGGRDVASPNLVLITVDTLRADFLGCYGNNQVRTPNIDDLAKNGVIFANAVAQASLTTPSHASILTGTYVRTHGSRDNCEFIYDSIPSIAEILRNSGYATAAFVSAYPLKANCSGIDRGFEVFNDHFSRLEPCRKLMISRLLDQLRVTKNDRAEQNAENVNAKALYWLRKNYRKKFFLWIHYYDPHAPYLPPRRFRAMYSSNYHGRVNGYQYDLQFWQKAISEDISEMISLYKGEVSYTDEQIGILLSRMERLDLFKNTMIVFTSDHGEGLSEHGHYFDHRTLYDHDIKVPLILSGKDLLHGERLVNKQVQSIDIMPTILDLLGIPIPKAIEGASLTNLMFGKDTNWTEESYSERREYVSIRTPYWKLIVLEGGIAELYNLERDNRETQNIIDSKNNVASELLEKLNEYKKKENREETKTKREMTEETKQKLRSLGYIR